jgi:hypothetical protein
MADGEHEQGVDRRGVLKIGAAATAGFFAHSVAGGIDRVLPGLPSNPVTATAIRMKPRPHRPTVGLFRQRQAASKRTTRRRCRSSSALDLGVKHRHLGALRWREARDERYIGTVRSAGAGVLATKTHDRTRRPYCSSARCNCCRPIIDLWQIHNLARLEQVEQIFSADGAVKALVEARDQKIVRHIGVTGHADPAVLLEAIRRHLFDSILLALNAADPHHLSFKQELLPTAVEKEMAIVGMKIPARGLLLSSWKPPADPASRFAGTRPGTLDYPEALRYVLSLPVSTVSSASTRSRSSRRTCGGPDVRAALRQPAEDAGGARRAGASPGAVLPPLGRLGRAGTDAGREVEQEPVHPRRHLVLHPVRRPGDHLDLDPVAQRRARNDQRLAEEAVARAPDDQRGHRHAQARRAARRAPQGGAPFSIAVSAGLPALPVAGEVLRRGVPAAVGERRASPAKSFRRIHPRAAGSWKERMYRLRRLRGRAAGRGASPPDAAR